MIKKLLLIARIGMPAIIIFLFVVRITVANNLASLGGQVREMDGRIATLSEENEQISLEIASASSLVTLSVVARRLGFVEPEKSQVITMTEDQFPVAFK